MQDDTTLRNAFALLDAAQRRGDAPDALEYHMTKRAILDIAKAVTRPMDNINPDGIGISLFAKFADITVVQHENDDPEMQAESVQLRRKAVSND